MQPAETWETTAINATHRLREHAPQDWQDYLDDVDQMARVDADIGDGWSPAADSIETDTARLGRHRVREQR